MPELGYFRVQVVDAAGNVCPDADNRIDVAVSSGAATFKGLCNGDATSLEPFVKPTMKAFHGELVVTVAAEGKCGVCKLLVTSPHLKDAHVTIPVQAE